MKWRLKYRNLICVFDFKYLDIVIFVVVDKIIRDGKIFLKYKDKRRWFKNLKFKYLVVYYSFIKI